MSFPRQGHVERHRGLSAHKHALCVGQVAVFAHLNRVGAGAQADVQPLIGGRPGLLLAIHDHLGIAGRDAE